MARKRAAILQTKWFGLIIGLAIVGLLLLFDATTRVPERLETRLLNTHFDLKNRFLTERIGEGVTIERQNPQISPDILLVSIDSRSLAEFGRWPFPRFRYADLVKNFSRIARTYERERALLLDLFFIEPSNDAYNDVLLIDAIRENGRVFLETIINFEPAPSEVAEEFFDRHEVLFDQAGTVTGVQGDWTAMPSYFGLEPPLQPYADVVSGWGHAVFVPDFDDVFRRAPMILRLSEELEVYALTPEELELIGPADFQVDYDNYQRLAWFDANGTDHTVGPPFDEAAFDDLRARMPGNSPTLTQDTDNDGTIDAEFYILRKYREHFIPAITLSLALRYFNKTYDDIEVVLGSHILIPDPQYATYVRVVDEDTGAETIVEEWVPYQVLVEPPVVDAEGAIVEEAVFRAVDEIRIPIDGNGEMLINYMGEPSSPAPGGNKTYPVRSMVGYASRVPGPDPETWPPTRAVGNQLVLVGPFAAGIAEDQKPTPYGLMYGVEVHANALNTIIMDNFLVRAPFWMNFVILLGMVMLISFMTSRLSTVVSIIVTLVLTFAYFVATTIVFDAEALILDFWMPAVGAALAFLAIVVYRVMSEERDKARIRATFGKYVSPKVVDQILANPPELGGVDKELTVFFSDIRGFTSLSEAMTPQELVNHLNGYLTAMTDVILEYEGTLDKYVGDEIMAFWGAPADQEDHAIRACKCALRQIEVLTELNSTMEPEKRINIGIGLNSGIMTVGNMGSSGRMNYTLTGDNVNLGSRLEGTNKQYLTTIIISEYTYGLVKDRIIARELDTLRVKGKNRPVQIYELIDVPEGLDHSPAVAKKG